MEESEQNQWKKAAAQAAAVLVEDGMVVGLGTGSTAADFLGGGLCRFALVDSREERSFVQRADAIGLRYAPGPRIEGFNINGGSPITIAIYRSERAP